MKQNCTRPNAVADIFGSDAFPRLRGQVCLCQHQDCVLLKATIRGLPQNNTGFYGFHIHEGNSCSGLDFSKSGSHYNPANVPHPRHAGDLPPLLSCNGNAYMTFTTSRFQVSEIIGRTIIVHDMPDDFRTQPSGNSGTKIACGVIKRI